MILHNDPYLGASHSPDVALIVPIFFEGEHVGFSAASAHLTDIGGAYPGLATDVVDIWAEGNIYRAVKLVEKGVRQEKLYRHILENTRTPTHNHGDIEAMIASAGAGENPLRRAAPSLREGRGARGRQRLDRLFGANAAPGDRRGARRHL